MKEKFGLKPRNQCIFLRFLRPIAYPINAQIPRQVTCFCFKTNRNRKMGSSLPIEEPLFSFASAFEIIAAIAARVVRRTPQTKQSGSRYFRHFCHLEVPQAYRG